MASNASARMLDISFNMILLVFFVFLNTIGENDDSKVKKALGSLNGAFGLLQGGLNITEGTKLLPEGPPMIDSFNNPVKLMSELRRFIQERQIEDQVQIYRQYQNIVINLSEELMFTSGSAELLPDAKKLLGTLAEILEQTKDQIRIEGHTDNIPISSHQYPSNWELSSSRAVSVLRYLLEEYSIPKDKLTAMGRGEYHPLVPNDTPDNLARNRRVSIILTREK